MSYAVPGVRLAALPCGIKANGATDLTLIEVCEGATVAGVFTQNAFCAAPVHVAKAHMQEAASRYLLINSGNANCGTGELGFIAANQSCKAIADVVGLPANSVLPYSTGVIGEPLPFEKIQNAAANIVAALSKDHWEQAAKGIMTTDTYPKLETITVVLSSGEVKLTGISKGAGMIKPNMATMLAYIATDAAIDQASLQRLMNRAADKSFNRCTVDGDTSTNDACMLIASGKGVALEEGSSDFELFAAALDELSIKLAQHIIRDGEGATKFVAVDVDGGLDSKECLAVAYAVAESPLVKTALFAEDANWGRILAAVGRAGVTALDVNRVNISLNDVRIVTNGGRDTDYTEAAGSEAMKSKEITIAIDLNRGGIKETVWTTDFSYDYVKINAEYRS